MRLTHIKLAGFKSFVDPVHVPVAGQLVGVVGPNGCGKSNVIDAVRWVLGESSAKQLRGENMQDVIFNGSIERKPVSRASVELIFDNSMGKATGPWSQYSEISVKRVLERNDVSSYYINNQHVRKRDVADIFLGTGLGGRGYAIIEQGMISRIIEARPEDLRNFLEEAAGVSKYRERRRETELRLEDTRENLLRVDDIRQELDKQLNHLETQAEQAERYRDLDRKLKTTQQTLWLTRKRDAARQREKIQSDIDTNVVELEARTAQMRAAESQAETLRAAHYAASDEVHTAQGELYESNSEVARLEQQIQHQRDTRRRAEQQLTAARAQQSELRENLERAEAALAQSRYDFETARVAVNQSASDSAIAQQGLPAAESEYERARERADEAQRQLAQAEQQLEVERTRRAHTDRVLDQLTARNARLEEERDKLELPEPAELVRIDRELADAGRVLGERRQALAEDEIRLPALEGALSEAEAAAEQAQQRLNQLDARLTALQQLQEQVSGAGEMEPWLERYGLVRNSRLWQGIRVREGWEDALESILRERLNSVAVEDLSSIQTLLSDAPPAKVSFHQLSSPGTAETNNSYGLERLVDYVTCTDERLAGVLASWLAGVYVISDPAQGVAAARQLKPGQVLVSAQGHIFAPASASLYAPDSEIHGILSRQREIETLFEERNRVDQQLRDALGAVTAAEAAVIEVRQGVNRSRSEVAELQDAQHQLKVDHVRLTQLADRITTRGTQIVDELEEISREVERETAQMKQAAATVDELSQRMEQLRSSLGASKQLLAEAEARLKAAREAVEQASRLHQESVFDQRTIYNKINDLINDIQKLHKDRLRLDNDAARLVGEIEQADEGALQSELQERLDTKAKREHSLASKRDALEAADASLRESEQSRLQIEQSLQPLRDRTNELRLKEQEARIAQENLSQQLAESGADEQALEVELQKGVRASQLQSEITRLGKAIEAIGAVNLAALEELATARERKSYLDAQAQDLTEAVATLENAIRRIDRETRERLQDTFDQVNNKFSEMFPALFGGGEAKLVLTGEEILDAGVQVIARPPGKRNSSIHLLSGGEKALTALSLVFSMFQLNPAPFCLLDEVDAPLDDNNTTRYCDLVKKMSESTQFVFITHNKITMEIAEQLVGVTMQEQGVSRVVSVDIEEAIRLREEAA
ncbi:MAG: chromosome segregation protein SMC [Betaproteobacteria bacterium]|nr:MAG: chromosome segregation protein SMC [Betaproteobacteria bacterium]